MREMGGVKWEEGRVRWEMGGDVEGSGRGED
jgi:hypothetical protein